MRRKIAFICLIIMSAAFCACVPNRSYRRGALHDQMPPAVVPIDGEACGNHKPYECVQTQDGYQAQHFYLAHIEFDDMGELWSIGNLNHDEGKWQSQLATALSVIKRAQEIAKLPKREVIVIAFVHGWHNNASAYDEEKKDLGNFKTVLQDLSTRTARDYPDRPPVLVGIFISWRGQVLAGNHLTSYWNRRDAATRVGGASLTEVVTRLMFATKGVPLAPGSADGCDSKPEEEYDNSHFVIIGHSFGARALEHGIDQSMLSLILERQAQAQECIATWNQHHAHGAPPESATFAAPADLLVFLNAANDSIEMKGIIEGLKRSGITVSRRSERDTSEPEPFLISITSDNDWATELIMPAAQWVSMPGMTFRTYDRTACEEGQLCDHSQSFYYRHSAASIPEMRSHTVIDQDLKSDDCKKAAETDDDWPYFTATVDSTERCFKIAENIVHPKDKTGREYPLWNKTPAFVINVPKTLIPGHTDIFQDGTEELLITIANHYDAFVSPTRLRTPAKLGFPSAP
jgi:hypothetical protein